jgi:hypothetical protein
MDFIEIQLRVQCVSCCVIQSANKTKRKLRYGISFVNKSGLIFGEQREISLVCFHYNL